MKYYFIAGESSGDLHGSNLMSNISLLDKNADFRYWGGDLMKNKGGHLVSHYKDRAFMGITDVLLNIGKIFKAIKQCKKDIELYQPDALILIDYPGFNLRIAKWAKENNIKVHYYISPKVWAWNNKRAYGIKKNVDFLYSILPFEVEFYKPYGIEPDYIGNPICDAISQYQFDSNFKGNYQINNNYIALLPGSRRSELKHILPLMLKASLNFPNYQFILAGANHISDEEYALYTKGYEVKIIKNKTYDVLKNAEAALVCSGTATLETALIGCHQVVCYKFSKISYWIGKMVVKVKYISLVNLILNKPLVKELIQNELTIENISKELNYILSEEGKNKLNSGYKELKKIVGEAGASERAAKLICKRTMN